MRSIVMFCLVVCAVPTGAAQLESYLPESVRYDEAIPRPSDVFGFEVGERHVRHDPLVRYMDLLAASSPRVTLTETGRTHEGRRLVLLAISSAENIRNLDTLRRRHLEEGEAGQPGNGPLVVWQGHSVHGNEASGSNMAPLLAYHLAAGQGPVAELLEDTVVLLDPALNPDGLARFAQWMDSHRSLHPTADPADREHHEVWPNGRTNHYWFDLNRDWLLLSQPESRARIEQFHRWRPHVLTDFHEMGSDATFFFQPGVATRNHPWTPPRNQELTARIAEYHARAFDQAGRLYYSGETFDDFYYGKGSTYPDVNGTVGILFEQASARGRRIETVHGELTLEETIRNQFRAALSTLEAADALRDELGEWQSGFWKDALQLAAGDADRAYIFGDGGDRDRAAALVDILRAHRIEVHALKRDVELAGETYRAGSAWVVPLKQRQYRLIKSVFETRTEFADQTFYDVSAFNLPLAFDLPFAALGRDYRSDSVGEPIDRVAPIMRGARPAPGAVAYAFEWTGYHAPRALQRLLAGDFSAYVALEPFTAATLEGTQSLDRGTIVVPVGSQSRKARARVDELMERVRQIDEEDGVTVVPITSGWTPKGIDLGSPRMRRLRPVKPLLVVGRGVRGYDAGEVWHLLDTRVEVPLTRVDTDRLAAVDLRDYTHVFLVDGRYDSHSEKWQPKLDRWVRSGGVLVAMKRGAEWVTKQRLHVPKKKKDQGELEQSPATAEPEAAEPEETGDRHRPYAAFAGDRAQRIVGGAIFQVIVDTTHPLGFGFGDPEVPVFRSNALVLKPSDNPYETVARYPDQPLVSGFASAARLEEIGGSAAIVATRVGKGLVVRMADNPNFRGVWYGTNKLFLNALYFGRVVDRTELDPSDRP